MPTLKSGAHRIVLSFLYALIKKSLCQVLQRGVPALQSQNTHIAVASHMIINFLLTPNISLNGLYVEVSRTLSSGC